MKHLVEGVGVLLAVLAWLAGAVLANGFWSTTFALVMPLWAWYLAAARDAGMGPAGVRLKTPNVGIEPPYSVGSNDGLGPF